jgi:hypothetical protein
MLQASRSSGVSARHLAQAPHRLMFFIGAGNVLMAMLWWAVWLASMRWPHVRVAPPPSVPAGWLHAFLMPLRGAAAIGCLIAFLPWVARLGWIYLTPRADGQPG